MKKNGIKLGDKTYYFSSDFLKMSADDFKDTMKKRYDLKVKEINELYKQLHGHDIEVSPEVEGDS